jgi:hypothetical protein
MSLRWGSFSSVFLRYALRLCDGQSSEAQKGRVPQIAQW